MSIANKQSIFSSFNTLLRKKPKSLTTARTANPIYSIKTVDKGSESVSLSALRRDTTIFHSDEYVNEIVDSDTCTICQEIKVDRDFRGAFIELNQFLFKTPVDIVFSSSRPEEDFIQNLCKQENAEKIESWIKSKNQYFYAIEYSLTRQDSSHTKKQQQFNPDFFILINDGTTEYIIVVEIKADGDDSDENKAKYKYAKQHFRVLNDALKDAKINQKYVFHFLSPSNYIEFFDHLRNGKLVKEEFTSGLDNLLEGLEEE